MFIGHPIYKMVYEDDEDPGALFASYMVALQITTVVNDKVEIIYDNPLSNSPISCRWDKVHLLWECQKKLQTLSDVV